MFSCQRQILCGINTEFKSGNLIYGALICAGFSLNIKPNPKSLEICKDKLREEIHQRIVMIDEMERLYDSQLDTLCPSAFRHSCGSISSHLKTQIIRRDENLDDYRESFFVNGTRTEKQIYIAAMLERAFDSAAKIGNITLFTNKIELAESEL